MTKVSFVLATTEQGSFIVNRNDYAVYPDGQSFGVGHSLLTDGVYEPGLSHMVQTLLSLRRELYPGDVYLVDAGANVGVHTIPWAKHMQGWGQVLALEPQPALYYALCGNVALNNVWRNTQCERIALGTPGDTIEVPSVDYDLPASYGSLELHGAQYEPIGQAVDRSHTTTTQMVSIDWFNLGRCDLIKLDVEGMESAAIRSAHQTLQRCRPVLVIEYVKSDREELVALLQRNYYKTMVIDQMNLLAVHQDDGVLQKLQSSFDAKQKDGADGL